MKKLIFLLLLIGMFFISFASANSNLGTIKQSDCVTLYQTCPLCSYVNLTGIKYPNGTSIIYNIGFIKSGTEYTYNFCNTSQIGDYTYFVLGDKDGNQVTEGIDFKVTPSGSSSNLGFYIIVILLIYAITLIGFFGKNEIVALFGALTMIALGVYLINQGLVIYRDWITNFLAYISIGLGAYIAFMASYSLIEDL